MPDQSLPERYRRTRRQSLLACEPLCIEDYGLQAEAFTSPPKWHLAHTTWFFETFLLKPFLVDYRSPDDRYELLFNSYYNGVGEQYTRSQRGLLSRPTVAQVRQYRESVDRAMNLLLEALDHPQRDLILARCCLGIEHEQQHQELFYTDLKYALFANPILPGYSNPDAAHPDEPEPEGGSFAARQWREYGGGLVEVGCTETGEHAFAFDNEGPAHSVFLGAYAIGRRLVSNGEFQDFVDDGGYQRPEFWLSDGWAIAQQEQWRQPLYWLERDGRQLQFTLRGVQAREAAQPVCHLSGYEADAYATWAGARLPTEFEWEHAARQQRSAAPEFDPNKLHPTVAGDDTQDILQLFGDCWQWTGSAYRPYPGFRAAEGAIGEYNGKFMANQWVLRGGSCVSQTGHVRPTYRNFFYPQDRWQFTGLRLARDL